MRTLWFILFLLLAGLLAVAYIATHGQAGTPYDRG